LRNAEPRLGAHWSLSEGAPSSADTDEIGTAINRSSLVTLCVRWYVIVTLPVTICPILSVTTWRKFDSSTNRDAAISSRADCSRKASISSAQLKCDKCHNF
jgi:hypothetical protein